MRHFIFDLRCCHPGFHRLSWAALVVVLSFSFASGQSENRTFEAQHEQALRANPDDIHLRISLDSEKNSFHIGDSILLKYEFTADVSGKYVAGARYFDRAERSVLESFITDRPQDALDPLREFWQLYESLSGFLFSSSRTPELRLDSHPQYDTLELTHYLRFTKPGLYHLYVTTHSALPPPA